jgi:hypothetical protein
LFLHAHGQQRVAPDPIEVSGKECWSESSCGDLPAARPEGNRLPMSLLEQRHRERQEN